MRCGFASLIGRPNAGKSTLLNRLVGTKLAIVSDKPQTTRNRIVGVRNVAGDTPGQVVFVDTPGIHRPLHRMNVRMVDVALDAIRSVDVVVMVLDAAVDTGAGDRFVLRLTEHVSAPVVAALNKIDLIAKPRLLPVIDWYRQQREFAAIVPVSALTGDGCERLLSTVLELLPEGEPLYPDDFVTDQPERVLVAEAVREKLLRHTRAELPFSTAVVVDKFEDAGRDGLIRAWCSILVDRPSQKAIVIGRGGAQIKRIGTEARADLERFFAARLHLDLHVRVRAGWREDERMLDEIGVARRR